MKNESSNFYNIYSFMTEIFSLNIEENELKEILPISRWNEVMGVIVYRKDSESIDQCIEHLKDLKELK